jgi:hypothetical protein
MNLVIPSFNTISYGNSVMFCRRQHKGSEGCDNPLESLLILPMTVHTQDIIHTQIKLPSSIQNRHILHHMLMVAKKMKSVFGAE